MEEERDETRADWLHSAPHRHCEIRTDTGNTGLNMEMSFFFSSCFCLSLSFLPSRPSFLPLSQLVPPSRIVFAFWQKAEKGGKCGETFKSED